MGVRVPPFAMNSLVLILASLFAEPIASNITSFEVHSRPKVHVDEYHFPDRYEQLENIDIDASRKMRVSLDLSGDYPILKKINYEGTFGDLNSKLTGHFPTLQEVCFACASTTMKLDLRGKWEQNCTFTLKGGRGIIDLHLPSNCGLTVHTKVGIKGRVINNTLKKKGRGILKKTYTNPLQETAPIQLTLNIEMTEGQVILN